MRHDPPPGIAEGGGSAALIAATSATLAEGPDDVGVVARCDVPMCVVDATAPDMPISFANAAFVALSGYEPQEIVGRNCRFMQGPATSPKDAAQFRAGFASGQPFQVSIVNHRKSGEAFHNEVFVSPVRDDAGAVVRFIGMQVAITPPGAVELEAVAGLRHQFRNQIQTMTSLVSLVGQRLPEGEGRDAFEDLRARFEAVTIAQTDDLTTDGPAPTGRALARLADRLVQLYDPNRRHAVAVTIDPFSTSARRAALLAQILTELVIDLFRNGLSNGSGRAEIAVASTGGDAIRLRVAADQAATTEPLGSTELGLAIVQSLTRSLGGSFERRLDGALRSEAILPAETDRR